MAECLAFKIFDFKFVKLVFPDFPSAAGFIMATFLAWAAAVATSTAASEPGR